MLTREWATLAEFADMGLPGVPERRALQDFADRHQWKRPERRNRSWRARDGAGGGVEFHYTMLNREAQVVWVRRHSVMTVEEERSLVEAADQRFSEPDSESGLNDFSQHSADMRDDEPCLG